MDKKAKSTQREQSISGRRNRTCKVFKAGKSLASSRTKMQVSVS